MKNKKLWQTGDGLLHPLVEKYTVGDDYLLDQELLKYDIQASMAHADMLFEMGILDVEDLKKATEGLTEISGKLECGKFTISQSQEDGHTAIEQYLTEKYGEIGKKIHTGRSRNDQSLVMIRLFMKEKLKEIDQKIDKLITSLNVQSKICANIPMPGYTHMQKAMPTKVGVWLNSYACALKDAKEILKATLHIVDKNPLGSASGFGISNFPMKREITMRELGFAKTQENPMYCGMSRGLFENIVLQTLSTVITISGKFANDMLMFTTSEFGFFSLPDQFTTGSSIMPQKRNYDVFEIMRGNTKVFNSYQSQIQDIVSSIGGNYQRDLQLTKKPFILGVNMCIDTLDLLFEIIVNLKANEAKLKEAMTPDLFVTNDLYDLVNKGESFREAYGKIKESLINE